MDACTRSGTARPAAFGSPQQAGGRPRSVTTEISEQDRVANPVDADLVGALREALAALAEPWIVLASRRASGADGPPWVRYVVLHPDKGIALVDTEDAGPAVAPLDDFLWHTGFAALQDDELCIVAVTIAETSVVVADKIDAAFGGSPHGLANPNWCEAVIDLLLATPDLMLTRLRPSAPPAVAAPPVSWHGDEARQSPSETALSVPVGERWLAAPESVPSQPTWRSWPISPVAVAMVLLALGAVAVVSYQASPPANEIARTPPAAVVASPVAPTAETVPSPTATGALPPAAAAAASAPPADVAIAKIPPVVQPKKAQPRAAAEHAARRPVTSPTKSAAPPSRQDAQVASANTTRAVCADVLHPDLPGGWQYHGRPVPQCLPIRFFGLIGMR